MTYKPNSTQGSSSVLFPRAIRNEAGKQARKTERETKQLMIKRIIYFWFCKTFLAETVGLSPTHQPDMWKQHPRRQVLSQNPPSSLQVGVSWQQDSSVRFKYLYFIKIPLPHPCLTLLVKVRVNFTYLSLISLSSLSLISSHLSWRLAIYS